MTPSADFVPSSLDDQAGHHTVEIDANRHWKHTNVYANGELLATYDPAGLHYALPDWLGDKRLQASAKGVAELDCWNLPYNELYGCSGTDATEHRYTGKEHDPYTSLDLFGAREYTNFSGRWLSPDSLNLTDDRLLNPANTLNKYGYGANNPLKYVDPDGKDITVFYESPSGLTSPGHIMFVAANQATGDAAAMSFGPVNDGSNVTLGLEALGSPVNSTSAFGLTNANGQPMTADDLRQNYSSLTIQTSPEVAQQVIEFIRNLSNSANPYELYKTNCTTVCREALKAVGILPNNNKNVTPNGLWRSLFAKNASSHWYKTSGWSTSKTGTDFGNPREGYDSFQLLELLNKQCTDSWNSSTNTLTSTCN